MGAQAPQITSRMEAQRGPEGEIFLARGVHVALRLWEEEAGFSDQPHQAEYETVGYLIHGRMRLTMAGETAELEAGQSWLIPPKTMHSFNVLESIQAIEATSPPSCETCFAKVSV